MAGGMQVASLFASLGIDTSGFQSGLGGAKGSLTGFGKDIIAQTIGVVSLGAAVVGAGKFVADSVNDWADYADSMRLSAQMAGVTTVEMSKLVQAADDFRVPIETMQKSMEMALKNGFTPTIDNLAVLSDELLAIVDPAERAEAASKIFGKSYADMMPFLLAGGDAIRGATDAIADNLIVTADAAASAKEYKDQLDALGDTWTGLKNSFGQAVVPTAIEVIRKATEALDNPGRVKRFTEMSAAFKDMGLDISGITKPYESFGGAIIAADAELITQMSTVEDWAKTTSQAFVNSGDSAEVANAKTVKLFNTYGSGIATTSDWADANDRAYEGLNEVAAAAESATVEWDAYVAAVGNITSLTANFGSIIGLAKTYDGILGDIAANAEERDRLMAAGFSETSEEVKALDDSTLALNGQMANLANQMTLDMYQAAIAIDGITQAEADSYFQMASDMGIISTDAAAAATLAYGNAVDAVNALTIDDKEGNVTANIAAALAAFDYLEQYALLDKEQRVFVTTYYDSGGYDYNTNDRPGDSVPVVTPDSGGGATGGQTNSSSNNYNLTMYTSSNPADVRTAFELMEVWA